MSLKKEDFQKFMKRLRKANSSINSDKIKYYVCGEYGGKTKRPHYHAIIFNAASHQLIETAWNLGAVHYGNVEGASVGYTLKYMNKRKEIPAHRNDDRDMEFSLMSKGLGVSYITYNSHRYHTADLFGRMCLTIEDGKKIAMPRYYKDKLYTETQREQIASWSKQQAEERLEEIKKRYGENYDRDKVQADLDAFRKQNKSSNQRDKL